MAPKAKSKAKAKAKAKMRGGLHQRRRRMQADIATSKLAELVV